MLSTASLRSSGFLSPDRLKPKITATANSPPINISTNQFDRSTESPGTYPSKDVEVKVLDPESAPREPSSADEGTCEDVVAVDRELCSSVVSTVGWTTWSVVVSLNGQGDLGSSGYSWPLLQSALPTADPVPDPQARYSVSV